MKGDPRPPRAPCSAQGPVSVDPGPRACVLPAHLSPQTPSPKGRATRPPTPTALLVRAHEGAPAGRSSSAREFPACGSACRVLRQVNTHTGGHCPVGPARPRSHQLDKGGGPRGHGCRSRAGQDTWSTNRTLGGSQPSQGSRVGTRPAHASRRTPRGPRSSRAEPRRRRPFCSAVGSKARGSPARPRARDPAQARPLPAVTSAPRVLPSGYPSPGWSMLPDPPVLARTPGAWRPYLTVLPGDHSGLLGQGWLLGGPAGRGGTGLAGLLLAGRPHPPGQHVVPPPKLAEPHALCLQRLLQLQDADLRAAGRSAGPTASPGARCPLGGQP